MSYASISKLYFVLPYCFEINYFLMLNLFSCSTLANMYSYLAHQERVPLCEINFKLCTAAKVLVRLLNIFYSRDLITCMHRNEELVENGFLRLNSFSLVVDLNHNFFAFASIARRQGKEREQLIVVACGYKHEILLIG